MDGSWQLTVHVTDVPGRGTCDVSLRAKGDMSVGSVMIKLVETVPSAERVDWSDHALWWPEKRQWLQKTSWSLDQYDVQSDSPLHFVRMHRPLRLQLPDFQLVELRVDFSAKLFSLLTHIANTLGMRHPEELSVMRKPELKTNNNKPQTNGHVSNGSNNSSPAHAWDSTDSSGSGSTAGHSGGLLAISTPQGTLLRATGEVSPLGSPLHVSLHGDLTSSTSGSESGDFPLATSPSLSVRQALSQLPRCKTRIDRTQLNSRWLNSSLSLMEQDVGEDETLLLRYKLLSFYDLNPKYDAVRINQLYEQAKWSLLSQQLDCSDEQAVMFAALQLQIQLRVRCGNDDVDNRRHQPAPEDDIDAALNDLQLCLEGSACGPAPRARARDITTVPELSDSVRYLRPRRLTLRGYKRAHIVLRDTTLRLYRSIDDKNKGAQPIVTTQLNDGSDVQPAANVSSDRYCVKIMLSEDSDDEVLQELWLRFDTEDKYCRWTPALTLAASGRTLADSSYDQHVSSLKSLLALQRPATVAEDRLVRSSSPLASSVQPEQLMASRNLKHLKPAQALSRIVDAHSQVSELTSTEAKLRYIGAWQALPEHDLAYFLCSVRMRNRNKYKEELVGVGRDRIVLSDTSSGQVLRAWRYEDLSHWKCNWDNQQMDLTFSREQLSIRCVSCDVRVLNELIGGYIFLSLRAGDRPQSLDEDLYFRLTCPELS